MRHLGMVAGGVCILLAGFASQFTLLAAPMVKPSVGDVFVLNSGVATNQPLCDQAVCGPQPLTLVASMQVPAGSYTIAAKLVINRWNSTTVAQSYCYLYAGITLIDAIGASTSPEIEFVPASLQGARTFSAAETLSIKCADSNGLTAAQNWQLMATKIGALNLITP
jgi:hypothetical protein